MLLIDRNETLSTDGVKISSAIPDNINMYQELQNCRSQIRASALLHSMEFKIPKQWILIDGIECKYDAKMRLFFNETEILIRVEYDIIHAIYNDDYILIRCRWTELEF